MNRLFCFIKCVFEKIVPSKSELSSCSWVLGLLAGVTGINIWTHITILQNFVLYFSSPFDPMWLRILAVFPTPTALLVITHICWILYAYIIMCGSREADLVSLPSRRSRLADYIYLTILIVFTFISLLNELNLMLLGTFEFGAVEQNSFLQRLVTGFTLCPNFAITFLCLLGWLIVGFYRACYFIKIKQAEYVKG